MGSEGLGAGADATAPSRLRHASIEPLNVTYPNDISPQPHPVEGNMTAPFNRDLVIGCAFLATGLLLWAGNVSITRAAMLEDVPPLAFNFWRWSLALAIFLPFTAHRVWRQRHAILARWKFFTAFGLVSITAFNSLYYVGLQYTTAVQGSLIMALLPVLVLVSLIAFTGERITGRQVQGVALSIAGAALIVLRGDIDVLLTLRFNIGDLWCLGALIVWSWQILMLRRKPANLDMPTFMTVTIAVGVAFQAPAYLWEIGTGRNLVPTWQTLAFLGYVAGFASVIGTTMYNAGVVRVGTATAGNFGNLYPLFAAGLAVIFLGEPFEWFHGVGAVLVLAGIYFATVSRARAQPIPN